MIGTAGWHGQRKPVLWAPFDFHKVCFLQLNHKRFPQINTESTKVYRVYKNVNTWSIDCSSTEVRDNTACPMCVWPTSSPLSTQPIASLLCEIPKHWLIHLYWSEFSLRCVASPWNIQTRVLEITIIWTLLGASNESGCIQITEAQSDWNNACTIMVSDFFSLWSRCRENWLLN